jgi:hypothetical protein
LQSTCWACSAQSSLRKDLYLIKASGLAPLTRSLCKDLYLNKSGPLALNTFSTTSACHPALLSTSRFLAPHHHHCPVFENQNSATNSWRSLFIMADNSGSNLFRAMREDNFDSSDDDPFFSPIPEPQTDFGEWEAQMETSIPAQHSEPSLESPTANQQGTIPSKTQSSTLLTVPIKSLQVLTPPRPARNERGRANECRLTSSNQTVLRQRDQSLIPLPKVRSLQSRSRIQRASEGCVSHHLRLRHVRTYPVTSSPPRVAIPRY